MEIQFSQSYTAQGTLKTEYPGIRYVPVVHEPRQAERHDLCFRASDKSESCESRIAPGSAMTDTGLMILP
jgi:hypothetical protein